MDPNSQPKPSSEDVAGSTPPVQPGSDPAVPSPSPTQAASPASVPAPDAKSRKSGSTNGIVAGIVAAVLLLSVGGAAAVILGGIFDSPEERVSKAMQGVLKDDEGRFEARLTNEEVDVTLGGGYNLDQNQFDLDIDINAEGVEIGAEARIVEGMAYAKVDDLGPLGALLGEERVDNVWYELSEDEFNNTVVDGDEELSCVIDALGSYGQDDRDALAKAYADNSLFNVEEDGKEDGYSKYILTANQETGRSFAEQVTDTVPFFKAVEDCEGNTPLGIDDLEGTANEASNDGTVVYALLDGSELKRLVLDSEEPGEEVRVEIDFDLGARVDIEVPEDAKPVSDLLESDLLNGLIGNFIGAPATSSLGGSSFSSVQDRGQDTERKTDINAMFAQLEVFYNENGYYPAEFNLSDFPGLDAQVLIDPDGGQMQVYASEFSFSDVFSNFETDYTYAPYECNLAAQQCAKYELRAELSLSSDEFSYTKESLN